MDYPCPALVLNPGIQQSIVLIPVYIITLCRLYFKCWKTQLFNEFDYFICLIGGGIIGTAYKFIFLKMSKQESAASAKGSVEMVVVAATVEAFVLCMYDCSKK